MDVGSWRPTDSGNAGGLAPDFWPEGQHPSTLNDCGRALMGGAARWFKDTNGSIAGVNHVLSGGNPAMYFPVNANFSGTAAVSLLVGTTPHDASATHNFLCLINDNTRQFVLFVTNDSSNLSVRGGEFSSGETLAVVPRDGNIALLPFHTKKTKLLASGSITSSVSSFTISGLSADGVIHIAVSGMRAASTGSGLKMRFGNPTIQSGSTDYECAAVRAFDPSTAAAFGSTSTSAISISLASVSPEFARLYARLHGFGDGKVAPSVAWTVHHNRLIGTESAMSNGHGSMTRQLTADAVQFFFSSANFTANTNNPIYYRAWTE